MEHGERPEPLLDRARAAIALIVLVLVAAAVSLWADLQQLDLLSRAADGSRVTLAEAQASDDRVATAGLAYTVALALAAVTFLLWYSRAYRNIKALGVLRPRWGRKWAVAYWFIPIANLFRPKQVMNDLWRGSDPQLTARAASIEKRPVNPLLHWWWAAWLVSGWIANFAIRASFTDRPTIEDLKTQATAFIVTDIADLVAGVLAVLVIWKITTRQEERRQAFEKGELPRQDESQGTGPDPGVLPAPAAAERLS